MSILPIDSTTFVNASRVDVAAYIVLGTYTHSLGRLLFADLTNQLIAARMEWTALWEKIRVRNRSWNGIDPILALTAHTGNGAQQTLSIGVQRLHQKLVDGPGLNHAAQVHHIHIINHVGDDPQIMRD